MANRFDDDGPVRRRSASPPYPGGMVVAGVIWIIIGSLVLLNGIYFLAAIGGAGEAKAGAAVGGTIGILFFALFGGVFIFVGVQSINGTARV